MLDNKINCPECASKTIYRIPSHQEPLSLAYIIVFGFYLYLILPAMPSKFRCDSCGHVFRRYTLLNWFYLGLLGVVLLLFVYPWLSYLIRYALWALSK